MEHENQSREPQFCLWTKKRAMREENLAPLPKRRRAAAVQDADALPNGLLAAKRPNVNSRGCKPTEPIPMMVRPLTGSNVFPLPDRELTPTAIHVPPQSGLPERGCVADQPQRWRHAAADAPRTAALPQNRRPRQPCVDSPSLARRSDGSAARRAYGN